MDTQTQLVPIRETASELGVSTDTVRRLIARKVLETVHVSARRVGIRRSSIDRLKSDGYRARTEAQ